MDEAIYGLLILPPDSRFEGPELDVPDTDTPISESMAQAEFPHWFEPLERLLAQLAERRTPAEHGG